MVEVVKSRRRRWPGLVMAIIVLAVAIGSGPRFARAAFGTSPWPFDPHTVGTPCRDDPAWVCGSIPVPLDRSSPSSATITVHFRILPRLELTRPAAGTVVVVNGGPGSPAMTQHRWAQKAFGSLLTDHDLLLADNRGTGASGRIDCPGADKEFTAATVARCRRILAPAVDDYGTVAATDDLNTILERVHADAVDLYSESYGTLFAQVFALRHARHLARLVFDGAIPIASDPWELDSLPIGLAALRTTCRANPACAEHGDPVTALARAVKLFRAPVPPQYISRFAYQLAALLANGGRAGTAFREIPAALRAYLAGDPRPVERLVHEVDAGKYTGDLSSDTKISDGLFLAVECNDEPQPFDLRAPIAQQKQQLAASRKAAAAARSRSSFPFIPKETTRMNSECLGWPATSQPIPQSLGHDYPDVPALVIEGGLDTVTPPLGAHIVASEFPRSQYVEVPFVGHVAALNDRSGCASSIAASFIGSGAIDTACLARIVAPPQVDAFPTTLAQEKPVAAGDNSSGTKLPANDRRMIAVVRDVVSDTLWRWARLRLFSGYGLRGGTFTTYQARVDGDFEVGLHAIRWTEDTSVSGEIITHSDNDTMSAELDISTPAGQAQVDVSSEQILGSKTFETITGLTAGRRQIDVTVDAKLGL